MPNPKSSGTGYNFVKSLVNAWGEDGAFDYLLRPSGRQRVPVHLIGIGPGERARSGRGRHRSGHDVLGRVRDQPGRVPLKVLLLFFEEGAPWAVYGMGIVEGKGSRAAVREVFDLAFTGGPRSTTTYARSGARGLQGRDPELPDRYRLRRHDGHHRPRREKKRPLGRWKYR